VKIDADRVREWLRRGARPSDSARDLLVAQGILAGNPKRERGSVGLGAAPAQEETPAEVKPAVAVPKKGQAVAEAEPVAVAVAVETEPVADAADVETASVSEDQ
jgi:hypothetical protein